MGGFYYDLFQALECGSAIVKGQSDENNRVTNYSIIDVNEALTEVVGKSKNFIIGKCLFDLFLEMYEEWKDLFVDLNAFHKVNKTFSYFPTCNKHLLIKVMYLEDSVYGILFIDRDVAKDERVMVDNIKLEEATKKLEVTEKKLMEEDKLANIGQLSAGIAHEINNPLGFVLSNFETLKKYINRFKTTILSYREFKNSIMNSSDKDDFCVKEYISSIEDERSLDFIMEDLNELFMDTEDGLVRVRKIVLALRSFSRQDQDGVFEEYDLNSGIETSLLIAKNEIKYTADVEISFGEIPLLVKFL